MSPEEDKATCLELARRIEHDVEVARYHRWINTCLQILLMLVVAGLFWRDIIISRDVHTSIKLAQEATAKSLEIRGRQDLYRQQYLDYIKDMIDTLQKFQDENPSIRVPKAPIPRPLIPATDGDVDVYDLGRIPQTKPAPTPAPTLTPVVKTKVVIKYKNRPTPKPKRNWWESTR